MARRRTLAERTRIVEAFLRSGLTKRQFALQNGLSLTSLERWHKAHAEARPATTFVEVRTDPPTPNAWTVAMEGRPALTFEARPDPAWLGTLLRSLAC